MIIYRPEDLIKREKALDKAYRGKRKGTFNLVLGGASTQIFPPN